LQDFFFFEKGLAKLGATNQVEQVYASHDVVPSCIMVLVASDLAVAVCHRINGFHVFPFQHQQQDHIALTWCQSQVPDINTRSHHPERPADTLGRQTSFQRHYTSYKLRQCGANLFIVPHWR
jgi:hypothetical protein